MTKAKDVLDSKELITREWLLSIKPPEDCDLLDIEEACAQWVGRTVGELMQYGLRVAAHGVLNEGMLPHVRPIAFNNGEARVIAWKHFKTEVLRLAGEHEGQPKQSTLDAVFEHYRVSEARKREIAFYVARALELCENAIRGAPSVDTLPEFGTLVLRDRD